MEVLKVSAKSNPNSVAGALAGFCVNVEQPNFKRSVQALEPSNESCSYRDEDLLRQVEWI